VVLLISRRSLHVILGSKFTKCKEIIIFLKKRRKEENRFHFIMAQAKPHPNILLNFNFSLYIINLISKSKFIFFNFR
jgi:hypothetical protein